MSLPTVYLPQSLRKPLLRGHPWVYRDHVDAGFQLPSGTWVKIRCGNLTAYGLWDAQSPIALRVFSRQDLPDAAWVAHRVRDAWEIREPLRQEATSAYRWVYGESDALPGIVADLYNDYVVVETYAESLDVLLDWVVDGLVACLPLKGVLLRRNGDPPQSLWGREPGRDMVVEEKGLRLSVDLFAGQKTGLFLDQRENRSYVEQWSGDRRVLNCFAYTGAFSLYAVRGGARTVVSAEIAPDAVQQIRRNLALNGFDPDLHPAVVADCFELLREYASRDERFELIILDPPSFGHSKKSVHSALRAYAHLNSEAMRCLTPGGLLATASCTSRVSPTAFREMLGDAAARAGKRLLILHESGHAVDHPVPAHFFEGRYLKFILGRVVDIV